MLSNLTAESVRIDEEGPDGTFLTIKTEEVGTISVNIQDIILEFEAEVYSKLHAYALEAQHAREAVANGVSLREYVTGVPDTDAYALDDPKHPTYHDRVTAGLDLHAEVLRGAERMLRGEA